MRGWEELLIALGFAYEGFGTEGIAIVYGRIDNDSKRYVWMAMKAHLGILHGSNTDIAFACSRRACVLLMSHITQHSGLFRFQLFIICIKRLRF